MTITKQAGWANPSKPTPLPFPLTISPGTTPRSNGPQLQKASSNAATALTATAISTKRPATLATAQRVAAKLLLKDEPSGLLVTASDDGELGSQRINSDKS